MYQEVTQAFLAGLKKQAVESGQDKSTLEHELPVKAKSDAFASLHADFHCNLISKLSKHRAYTSEVLHFFFSTPSKSSAIPNDLRDEYEAIHEILGLQDGSALLHRGHVLCQQYYQAPGAELLSLFPTSGRFQSKSLISTRRQNKGSFLRL
jgi:hypothetical protein